VSSTQTATQTFLDPGFGVIFVVLARSNSAWHTNFSKYGTVGSNIPSMCSNLGAHLERNLLSENQKY
jgi:hypothetical protein